MHTRRRRSRNLTTGLRPLCLLLVLSGCRTEERPLQVKVPEWFPASLKVAEYAGAAACAECHQKAYEEWKGSPHGRAMALPDDQTVLAPFDGKPVRLRDGTVTPSREAGGWFMTMRSASGEERHRVELVLASGRQHQDYVTRTPEGNLVPLPIYWSTVGHRWNPIGPYFGGALDRAAPIYWGRSEVMELKCFNCHLSQARHRADGKRVETTWVDLPVNCEACHGPGRAHIAARRVGKADDYPNLHLVGKEEEGRLCGRCHAIKVESDYGDDLFPLTLAFPGFRPDSTQFSTSYQYAGHASSECYVKGSMTCAHCHTPHSQKARDLAGASAEGKDSNKQCTVCHRDRIETAAARKHTRHGDSVRCIDCHMRRTFIRDTPERDHETSDHAISIPRPRETLEFGIPNACDRCHKDKGTPWALEAVTKWGATRATGVRDSVRAIALARRQKPEATPMLLALLAAPGTGLYLRQSCLQLLTHQPRDPEIAAAAEPYTRDADPYLRSLAYEVLVAHDPARATAWRTRATSDPHPFVRTILVGAGDPRTLTEAEIRRDLDDILAHAKEPPATQIEWLAELRRKRGELIPARQLVDLARRLSSPLKRSDH
jgi:hypothetical protein